MILHLILLQIVDLMPLEVLLEDSGSSETLLVTLIKRLNKCMQSEHYQVAERALLIWNNEKFSGLIKTHKSLLMPVIIESLIANAKNHWHP